ncbi:sucrase ferredoxin [Corynebacterium sp.]|uniref:sucrase ferredoxin n=1 Tax=Corynebacterium sp. TaxID=1720 RepID=UPI0025C6ABAA|nr:sucrase ferredoxin [Corynebacterium sp.]
MPTPRNPRAGLCSDVTREPLPGTAKTGRLIVAVEYPQGWGKDILDGEALGRELAGQVKRWLKRYHAQLQFIRRPGRAGQVTVGQDGTAVAFIADAGATPPTLERLELPGGVRGLLDVDLSTPGAVPGATRVNHPLLLVCTHGKRDQCCALKGRPLAAALAERHGGESGDQVWESSHTKGHRFAPSMILLPHNYSFGTLDVPGASEMMTTLADGRLPVAGNRGRGTLDPRAQVAELAVAALLESQGRPVAPGELTVEKATPADGPAPGGGGNDGGNDGDTDEATDGGTDEAAREVYAAFSRAVDPELRRRAGELITERIEMKATGRHPELKELYRSGYFQPVRDYERAVKEAAEAHGLGRKKHGKHGKHGASGKDGNPVLRVRRGAQSWVVTLESRSCHPVVSSCGDRPKEGKAWVAVDVRPEVSRAG